MLLATLLAPAPIERDRYVDGVIKTLSTECIGPLSHTIGVDVRGTIRQYTLHQDAKFFYQSSDRMISVHLGSYIRRAFRDGDHRWFGKVRLTIRSGKVMEMQKLP